MRNILFFLFCLVNFGLFADEVHQDNIYSNSNCFYSFRKIIHNLGPTYDCVGIASFMSIGKGYAGECGLRAGYCELTNVCPEVKECLYREISAGSSSNSLSQAALDAIVYPPKVGDASFKLFEAERSRYLSQLKTNNEIVSKNLSTCTGIMCSNIEGGCYTFPNITLPASFIKEANANRLLPDEYYCQKLLEVTGVSMKPGSQFGQLPGTFHIRISMLLSVDKMSEAMEKLKDFQIYLFKNYF